MEKCDKKFPAALKSQVVLGKHLDFLQPAYYRELIANA